MRETARDSLVHYEEGQSVWFMEMVIIDTKL